MSLDQSRAEVGLKRVLANSTVWQSLTCFSRVQSYFQLSAKHRMFSIIGIALMVVCLATVGGDGNGLFWTTAQAAAIQCGTSTTDNSLKSVAEGIFYDSDLTVQNSSKSDNDSSGFKKFLHSVQCSLEKVKPWAEELEHEVRRIEETAKRISFGILKSFGRFFDKLVSIDVKSGQKTTTKSKTRSTTTESSNSFTTEAINVLDSTTKKKEFHAMASSASPEPDNTKLSLNSVSDMENEIFNESPLCPVGYVANSDGICERDFQISRG